MRRPFVLIVASILCAFSGFAAEEEGNKHVVVFPEDWAGGWFRVGRFEEGSPKASARHGDVYHEGEWANRAAAKGSIEIPPNEGLWLETPRDKFSLEFIRQLDPEDLFVLDFRADLPSDLSFLEGKRALRCVQLGILTPVSALSLPRLEGLQKLDAYLMRPREGAEPDPAAYGEFFDHFEKFPALRALNMNVPGGLMAKLESLPLEELGQPSNDISSISRITTLLRLNSSRIRLTAEDLQPLANLTQLRELDLSDAFTLMEKGDLSFLKSMPRLERLTLNRVNLNESALETLGSLTSLKTLGLCGNWRVLQNPQSLKFLPALTRLEDLYLCEDPIRDEHLDFITPLSSLRYLDLNSTEITDAGLHKLEQLKSLRLLTIFGSKMKVTDEAIGRLRAVIPDVFVMSGPAGGR